MPGPNAVSEPLREKLLKTDEFAQMSEAGLIVPLHEMTVLIDDKEEAFWLLFIRGHGIALHSRQTDRVYLVTAYGLLCLAKHAGIDKVLEVNSIVMPRSAVEVPRD